MTMSDHKLLIKMYKEEGMDSHAAYNQYIKDILPTGQKLYLGLADVLKIYQTKP